MAKTLASLLAEREPQKFFLGGVVKAVGSLFGGGGSSVRMPDFAHKDYSKQIDEARGQQNTVFQQQQNLAQALLGQSQGLSGPSVAQTQLQYATGQNVANQAALMASQRGASVNPALIARLAAQQGSQVQQQAMGQAAALRAQEQLAAQQALQQQQAQMAQQSIQTQGAYLGTQAQAAQANLQAQQIRAQQEASQMQAGSQLFGSLIGGGAQIGAAAWGKAHGGEIEGVATKSGDHEANDTVPALLSPGEIVLPRSVTQSKNAPQKAKEFVEALKSKKSGNGYEKVASAKMWKGGRAC